MLPHRNKWLPRHGLGPYVREDRADAVLLTMPPLNWRWQLRYRWWVTLLIVAVWICITYPVDHRSIWWQIGALSLAEAYLLVRSTIGLEIFVADDELIARSYCAFWDRTRRWHRCEVGAVRWNGLYSINIYSPRGNKIGAIRTFGVMGEAWTAAFAREVRVQFGF
jgi:hypothetical protein